MLAAGCKSAGGSRAPDNATPVSRTSDPLLGGKIPPQNLPVPGKDSYGSRDKRDPLLVAPADQPPDFGTDRTDRTKPPPDNKTASLPPTVKSSKEPFRPGKSTTPGALAAAGSLPTDGTTLAIPDPRPAATPLLRSDATADSYDRIAAELRRYGATFGDPVVDNREYVFRADVPLDGPGRVRRYEGVGSSSSAAAQQVLDQVRADLGTK